MDTFLLGGIALGALAAGLFFLRFWRDTGDRLFLMFAIAFWAEALNRTALALTVDRNEAAPLLYLVRVFGYALIVAAIIDKNRSKAGR